MGVDVFFVISGLVISMTGPLAEPRPSGLGFAWRRWARVAPMFYLMTVLALLAGLVCRALGFPAGGLDLNPDQTIATLFFWPAAGPALVNPYIAQGWTLSLEMLFYLAVSLVLVGGRLRRNLLLLTIAASVIVWARLWSGAPPLRFLTNRILIEFGYGVALALLLPRLTRAPALLGVGLLGVALGFYGYVAIAGDHDTTSGAMTLADQHTFGRVLLAGTPALCLVAAALILERRFKNPLLVTLGDASYSIYLVHALALFTLSRLWRSTGWPVPPEVVLITGFALAIAAGIVSYRLIERPLLAGLKGVPALVRGALRPSRPAESAG
jgi:peptidoglycan/LPS O-acetylase OafA/YrhL